MDEPVDYGSLGNLVLYLNGNDPLPERIQKAVKIFFIPLELPTQHKEEVVIQWLTDIICSEKESLHHEDTLQIWRTLRVLLTSKRLKTLSSHNWVCSVTQEFIQTLFSIISAVTTKSEVREEAVIICESLSQLPSFSHQKFFLSTRSLPLYTTLLINYFSDNLLKRKSLLKFLLRRNLEALYKSGPVKSFETMYNFVMLPSIKLAIHLQDEVSVDDQEIKQEIIKLISFVFSFENKAIYLNTLDRTFNEESKALDLRGESFYAFLISCVEEKDRDLACHMLKIYANAFFRSYKSSEVMIYQFIVIVMYLLNVETKDGLQIDSKKFASKALIKVPMESIVVKDKFILSFLEAIKGSKLDLDNKYGKLTLRNWLLQVLKLYISNNDKCSSSIQIITLLLKMEPMFIVSIPNLITGILHGSQDLELQSATNDLLYVILDVHVRLRTMHQLYEDLCKSVLTMKGYTILKSYPFHTCFTYDDNQFLPSKFLKKLLNCINGLGSQMWLTLWSSILKVLSKNCRASLKSKNSSYIKHGVSFVLHLSSCCISANSIVEFLSVSSVPAVISQNMESLVDSCIIPLLMYMDPKSDASEEFAYNTALLNLIVVWAELHILLLSTDTGYEPCKRFVMKPIHEWEQNQFYQLPFLKEDHWTEIYSSIDQEKDAYRYLMINLRVQRIHLIRNQLFSDELNNTSDNTARLTSMIAQDIEYIFKDIDINSLPMCSSFVAFHLPSLAPSLGKKEMATVARMFVSGFEQNVEIWVKLSKSLWYKSSSELQELVISLVCDRVLTLLSGSKRKLHETDLESETKPKYMTRKIIFSLIQILKNSENLQTDLLDSLGSIEDLMKSGTHRPKLCNRSEEEIMIVLNLLLTFPFRELSPLMTEVVLSLVLCLQLEEGYVDGRPNVLSRILFILNSLAASPHFHRLFQRVDSPSFLLTWMTKQFEHLTSSFSIDDVQLRIVLRDQNISELSYTKSSLIDLYIHFFKSLTTSFVSNYITGDEILLYAKNITQILQKSSIESCSLSSLLLASILKKKVKLKQKESKILIEVYEELGRGIISSLRTTNLADVTIVHLSLFFVIFTLLLRSSGYELVRNGKVVKVLIEFCPKNLCTDMGLKDIFQVVNAMIEKRAKASSTMDVSLIDEDIDFVLKEGMRYANVVEQSKNVILKQLCFEYLVSFLEYKNIVDGTNNWKNVKRAWTTLSKIEDKLSSAEMLRSFIEILPEKYCVKVIEELLENTKSEPAQRSTVAQWLCIVSAKSPEIKLLNEKMNIFDDLISVICINIINKNVGFQDPCIIEEWINVFLAILKSKSSISVQSKDLFLQIGFKLTAKTPEIALKMHNEYGRILITIMTLYPEFISEHPASILSVLFHLIFSVIAFGEEVTNEDELLQSHCSDLEKLVRDLKKYDIHVYKIIPFHLSKLVSKMQRASPVGCVKSFIERMLYKLIDLSDVYSLRHAMISIAPSSASLLKHYHSTYMSTYKHNPKAN